MNCKECNNRTKRNGKDRYGNQRFRCVACNKTYTEPKTKTLGNMYLPEDKAITILQLLVEGMSIRSIERVTDVHRDTILRLLETVGKKCFWIQENLVKDIKVKFVEADEIWAFVGMKDRTKVYKDLTDKHIGSTYTFTALDADSKLIVAWHLGSRTEDDAKIFLRKVRSAIIGATNEFQLSTDAFPGYKHSVPIVLSDKVHYGQVIKTYGATIPGQARYSPPECTGAKKKKISGNPIKSKISTSFVERQNLTMRMSIRRMTRLTNGFSKKWDNLNYSIALHFAHYNFCRSHKTLHGATPAMAAGLTKTIWSLKDLLTAATQN